MASSRQFDEGLDRLFRQFTEGLRREAGKSARGPAAKFDRHKLRRCIGRLVDIATETELTNNGKALFDGTCSDKKQWHAKRGKGWGLAARKKTFRDWYDLHVYGRNCVYVFWSKRKCIYVGRTGSGGRRPHAHFEKYWFSSVTRIDMYIIRGKRQLPKAECMAIHLFKPNKNKMKSAQQKFRSKCPICSKEVSVRQSLNRIFTQRKK